eukprot:265124-Alexandrium_andersonii.AAC.1
MAPPLGPSPAPAIAGPPAPSRPAEDHLSPARSEPPSAAAGGAHPPATLLPTSAAAPTAALRPVGPGTTPFLQIHGASWGPA